MTIVKVPYCSLWLPNRMPSANCRKKLVHRRFQSGIKNGGANCRICAEKLFLPKLQKGPPQLQFLFYYGSSFGKKKKVKGKKSKKVNPLDFIVVKVKYTYFGPKRSVRGRARERERGLFNPVLGRVLEPETNPSGYQGGS